MTAFAAGIVFSENDPQLLQADILKISRHGGKNATMPDFLDVVHPRLAVISAAEGNPYGYSGPVLLKRLRQADVPVLRTDQNGVIYISTDAKRFEVSCFVACPQITAMLDSDRAQPPDDQKHEE